MSRWVTGITIGCLAGMVLAAWLGRGAVVAALFVMVGAVVFVSVRKNRSEIWLGIGALLALWAGMFLYTQEFERWQGLSETVEFSGTTEIVERGEIKVFYRPVTIRPIEAGWQGGDILYRAPIDFEGTPGERVSLICRLVRPKNFEPGFDYRNLLASRRTGYVCERGEYGEALPRESFNIRAELAGIQAGFRERLNQLLPEPESGLLTGLLIGGSDTLGPETKAAFARAGLSHIVAVSGYNMSIVAEGIVIFALMLGTWRHYAISFAMVGLVFFILIIDGSAASLRAALMAWFAFGAYYAGRPTASWNGLLLAGTGMLLYNPLLIRYDVGFQLSFLATLALLVLARNFDTFDVFRTWYGKGTMLLLATVFIEIFTLPVIVSTFGTLSLIAPVANAIVLPLVPVAMFVGIFTLIATLLLPVLGFLLLPLVWLPLAMIIRLTEFLGGLPGASLSGLDMTSRFAVLWYVGLAFGVYFLERLRKRYVLGMDH